MATQKIKHNKNNSIAVKIDAKAENSNLENRPHPVKTTNKKLVVATYPSFSFGKFIFKILLVATNACICG